MTSRNVLILLVTLCVYFLPDLARAGGTSKIYLSEYKRDKSSGDDIFEITNEESSAVDISCWTIESSGGTHKIADSTTIPGSGGTVVITTAPIVDSVTDDIQLIDDLKSPFAATIIDRVRFGTTGGAPAAPLGVDDATLARAPGTDTFPPQSPPDEENYWTLDLTGTLGSANDAPDPALGTSLLINEVRIGSASPDSIEIYNPNGTPVDIDGWFATSAADVVFLSGTVVPFGFLALEVDGLDFETTLRVDLFDADSVRVDQKGWEGSPNPLSVTECFGCCPDGSAPSSGYNFDTSGGDVSWFGLPCSLGSGNEIEGDPCEPAGVPPIDPPPDGHPVIVNGTWGSVKLGFQEE